MQLRYPQSFAPALGVTLACLAAAPARAEDYAFKVFCNGNPVGYQHVQVRHDDDGQTLVDTDVAVDVHMAGFEIYRYRYRARESWRDGRLTELTSETDDDGEALSLSVHPAEDGMLLVESKEGRRKIPADTLPTSYWNPAVLDRRELLDSESGKLLKVAVSSHGDGRYSVSGDLNAEVDYRFGRWAGAHFHYFGAEIDIRPEEPLMVEGTR
jgi:hypothetical protein